MDGKNSPQRTRSDVGLVRLDSFILNGIHFNERNCRVQTNWPRQSFKYELVERLSIKIGQQKPTYLSLRILSLRNARRRVAAFFESFVHFSGGKTLCERP